MQELKKRLNGSLKLEATRVLKVSIENRFGRCHS